MLKGVEVGKPKYKSIEVLHMTRTVFVPVMASLRTNEVCCIESTRWTSIITHDRGRQSTCFCSVNIRVPARTGMPWLS